ncbi:unnamed protein product [Effrenium voratum]|uniref:Uncharacterized protein n=1 Tax=Effrenium voratum TaxID=2562239 RepID=A0AA36JGU5_9DINO|nr:unnamed protein product [Effrenium voratum]CAJ1457159.1 unnamed protein product [Effrenium voratum]
MRRIYPQVLQTEQAIQELRWEISEFEAQSKEQHAELNQASHQIQDLRSSLGAVERRKAVRRDAIANSRAESRQLEAETSEARSDERRIKEQLGSFAKETEVHRHLLQRAAAVRRNWLEEQQSNELSAQLLRQDATGLRDRCGSTQQELEVVERENDGLESELDGALFHSIRQRRFTAMEETEASTQFDNTCEAKALNSHGQRQLEGLQSCREYLTERLRNMVQARRDGDALDLRLAENWDQHNSLQYSWRQLCQTVQVRSLVLEEVNSDHAQLSRKLEESECQADLAEEEARSLTRQKEEQHAMCRGEEEEVASAEAKMRQVEEMLQGEHREAEAEVQAASGHRAGQSEKVDKLQAHISDNLQSQLKGLDDENRHLQSRIAFFEKDTEDLLAQNEELERTMEEVKKKMNCTIS